ncbi:sugar ABC transporter ATP-binding protein [Alicyclobacillus vulcanalis]|uniref:Monosaccharide ABC transporter ATP-binding protein, CUT2 family n=1 Tax=Alicyclobacillus vulcanalis TaxID=252246 RepID=A0A1N7K881_9BACL|nr:sugar ABC transporter ATP-binding protein [Alicyclobacillus vulcanalis]SIS57664.1 monosaccharide ABC transporter ATP-binding protein, CUT2 family [Alicyclobacillus vulcanalis]
MQEILRVEGISKQFPGVKALDGARFSLRKGEVHVLLGENGAGKSTLMNVIGGVYRPDEGRMWLRGEPYRPQSALDALRAGVAVIHQELQLCPAQSVAENVFLGDEQRSMGWLRKKQMEEEAAQMLAELGLEIDPRTPVGQLGIAAQQLVEIAKMVRRKPDVLVMDEPTASLSEREVDRLFDIIQRLKRAGMSMIYISHRLNEIPRIGDRVTIMRDGRTIDTLDVRPGDRDRWIQLMVGREVHQMSFEPVARGDALLSVKGLTRHGAFRNVTFDVHAGEIVALAGMVGSGRTEVLRAIFGVDPVDAGEIWVRGRRVRIRGPADAIRLGIGLLPEDRKAQGLVLEQAIAHNVALASYPRVNGPLWYRGGRVEKLANLYGQRLRIKMSRSSERVAALSGGNQQKVMLARWLAAESEILMIDEPTRGVDIAAKFEIYHLLHELRQKGLAILMVSSELPEVLTLADRILVMREGEIAKELPREGASEEVIAQWAMAGSRL